MREVDKRSRFSRRGLLRTGAAAVPAAALLSTSTPAEAWLIEAKSVPVHTMETLVRMARDIFPHDQIANVYYWRAVSHWDDKAGKDKATHEMLTSGVTRLDEDAKDKFGVVYVAVPWEEQRVELLKGIEHTKFFGAVRGDLVVSLYNQKEIWPKFGYEGSSAEHGGYIHRGFGDIDWLPST